MTSSTLRLFIAVELTEAATRHVGEVIGRLRQAELPGIRWVRPEGVHLTLKFLGNVPESQVQPIVEAMGMAAGGVAPFALRVQGVGAFPHARAPRVLWVGIQGDLEPLTRLQERLEETLEVEGFSRELRSFSPHLTLGRVKGRFSSVEVERLARAMDRLGEVGPTGLPVTHLSLIESQLSREGAVYLRKAQITLD